MPTGLLTPAGWRHPPPPEHQRDCGHRADPASDRTARYLPGIWPDPGLPEHVVPIVAIDGRGPGTATYQRGWPGRAAARMVPRAPLPTGIGRAGDLNAEAGTARSSDPGRRRVTRTAANAMTRQPPDPAAVLASGRRLAGAGGRADPAAARSAGMSAVSAARSAQVRAVSARPARASSSSLVSRPCTNAVFSVSINRIRSAPPRTAATRAAAQRATAESLRARLNTARGEITRLRAENTMLREQAARHLGEQRAAIHPAHPRQPPVTPTRPRP